MYEPPVTDKSDTILLTIPADSRFRGVATLVLSGVGSRFDVPYERMDDLQLALLSALATGDGGETLSLEVEAGDQLVSVTVGPLRKGSSADPAFTRVLTGLVDSVESVYRDGQEWVTLRLSRAAESVDASSAG